MIFLLYRLDRLSPIAYRLSPIAYRIAYRLLRAGLLTVCVRDARDRTSKPQRQEQLPLRARRPRSRWRKSGGPTPRLTPTPVLGPPIARSRDRRALPRAQTREEATRTTRPRSRGAPRRTQSSKSSYDSTRTRRRSSRCGRRSPRRWAARARAAATTTSGCAPASSASGAAPPRAAHHGAPRPRRSRRPSRPKSPTTSCSSRTS